MRNYIERRRASDKGFTLIELLVVIVILGILAAVVVFAVAGLSDKGATNACKIDTRTLRTAQEAYYAEPSAGDGGYAADATALLDAKLLSDPAKYHSTTGGDADSGGKLQSFTIHVTDSKCGDTTAGDDSLVDADHPDNH